MNRSDGYFFRATLFAVLLTFVSVGVLYVAIDVIYNIDELFSRDASLLRVLRYYVFTTPKVLHFLAPLIVLMGGMFALARILKNRELLPLRVAGMPTARALAALWVVGLLSGLGMLVGSEYLLPSLDRYTRSLSDLPVRGGSGRDLTLHDARGSVWYIESYDVLSQPPVLRGVDITVLDASGHFVAKVTSDKLEYHDGQWVGDQRLFEFSQFIRPSSERPQRIVTHAAVADVELLPASIARRGTPGITRSLSEERERMREEAHNPEHRLNLYRMLVYPLSCLTLLVVGATIALRLEVRNAMLAGALTLAMAFGAYAISFFAEGLARRGAFSPEFACFGPAAALMLLAGGCLRWWMD